MSGKTGKRKRTLCDEYRHVLGTTKLDINGVAWDWEEEVWTWVSLGYKKRWHTEVSPAFGDLHFIKSFCYDSQLLYTAIKLNLSCCRVTNLQANVFPPLPQQKLWQDEIVILDFQFFQNNKSYSSITLLWAQTVSLKNNKKRQWRTKRVLSEQ